MPEAKPTAAEIVASWPTEPAWNHAVVNLTVAPDDTHAIAVPCYDECVDSKVVLLPDGSRRHVAFVREATTKDYLWRRGWVDQTEAFVALLAEAHTAHGEAEAAAKESDAVLAAILAAVAGSDAPRGVTALFLTRSLKLEPGVVESRLGALVAAGSIDRVGEGGPVVLYRLAKQAA
jgi:hypothetical protein